MTLEQAVEVLNRERHGGVAPPKVWRVSYDTLSGRCAQVNGAWGGDCIRESVAIAIAEEYEREQARPVTDKGA